MNNVAVYIVGENEDDANLDFIFQDYKSAREYADDFDPPMKVYEIWGRLDRTTIQPAD